MTEPRIRPYRANDLADVYDVCIRTGDGGADATGLRERDSILPDVYAGPYVTFHPDLAFVVEHDGRVRGYILATDDTAGFVRRYRSDWLPSFSERYGTAGTDPVLGAGLAPERMLLPVLDDYPAHLHIDLLPVVQRRGFGRILMDVLAETLRARGVPGIHLTADPANGPALAFYERLGFETLPAPHGGGAVRGLRL